MRSTLCKFSRAGLLGIGVLLYVGISLFYIYYGRIFLDAGFYLHSVSGVLHGQIPYRDFFYVQGPVYPYFYAFFMYFCGVNVLYARILSMVLATATMVIAANTSKKWGGDRSWYWTIASLCLAPMHAYYFSSVKLYALSGFFFTASIYFLVVERPSQRNYSLCIVMALLAAGTRLTLLPAILFLFIFIIWEYYRENNRLPVMTISIAILTSMVLALPMLILDREAVWYHLLKIHTSAEEGLFVFDFTKQIKVMAQIAVFYPLVTMGLLFLFYRGLIEKRILGINRIQIVTIVSVCAVTAAHLKANWFSADYQSILMPITAALISSMIGKYAQLKRVNHLYRLGLVILVAGSLWYQWEKPLWPGSGSVISHLSEIGARIRDVTTDSGEIAGCSAIFALESGRDVSPPFGGAPFIFTPNWTRQQCERFGGINTDMLVEKLQHQEMECLLFEPDSFSIGFPGFYSVPASVQKDLFSCVDRYYRAEEIFDNMGNADRNLVLYVRR